MTGSRRRGMELPPRLRTLVYAARKLRLKARRHCLDYEREGQARAVRLARVLDADYATLRRYGREYDDLDWFHEAYSRRVEEIHDAGVAADTTHWRDGKTLYVVCRALKPSVVVESGVRFGSFDAHALAAMEVNDHGAFYGLDLPGSPDGPFAYGHLVPDRCRGRWTLHTGDARDALSALVERVGPVELFLHDSDHRRPHMAFEYRTADAHLAPGGVLASHDVRLSSLFENFTTERGMPATVICDTGIARRPAEHDS